MKRLGDAAWIVAAAAILVAAGIGLFESARDYLRAGTFLEDVGALTVGAAFVMVASYGLGRRKK